MAKVRKAWINGEPHRVVVLLIKGRDEFGRPAEAVFVHEDQSVKLEDGLEFITAFVPSHVVAKGGQN